MADIPLSNIDIFSRWKNLPSTKVQSLILLIMSVAVGIVSVSVIHYHSSFGVEKDIIWGATIGILGITIPSMLTVITIKTLVRRVLSRHIIAIASFATFCYGVLFVLASSIFAVTNSYVYLFSIILVSDAGIFLLWFFTSKIFLNQRAKAIPFAVIQPTLNALFMIPASRILVQVSIPISTILVKLYAGILIFVAVGYIVTYLIDSPIKRGLGISGIDVFSQVIQNWVFEANVKLSSSKKTYVEMENQALIFKRRNGTIKSILFVPKIHYGLLGTIGSSDFPHTLERVALSKYKSQAFIMHSTVTEERNAFSSDQFVQVKNAMDTCISKSNRLTGGVSVYENVYKGCSVKMFRFGEVALVTLTRAPKVTEDITYDAGFIIRKELEKIVPNPIVVDAHNSRDESANNRELAGINTKSKELKYYIEAIKGLRKEKAHSSKVRIGTSSIDLYRELNAPKDIAQGMLNTMVLDVGKSRQCIIQFNGNNMLPKLRESIRRLIYEEYGLSAEVYTTDTHAVNSLQNMSESVIGSNTEYKKLKPIITVEVRKALENMEEVTPYYGEHTIEKFMIWGLDRESLVNVMKSMLAITRVLVPLTITLGFFAAALVVALI